MLYWGQFCENYPSRKACFQMANVNNNDFTKEQLVEAYVPHLHRHIGSQDSSGALPLHSPPRILLKGTL